jgi:hypothetical protein
MLFVGKVNFIVFLSNISSLVQVSNVKPGMNYPALDMGLRMETVTQAYSDSIAEKL